MKCSLLLKKVVNKSGIHPGTPGTFNHARLIAPIYYLISYDIITLFTNFPFDETFRPEREGGGGGGGVHIAMTLV